MKHILNFIKNLGSLLVVTLLPISTLYSQTLLNANGTGNTYEEINAILAPNHNVIEVPDCVHTTFGRHIDEVFDADLNEFVFRFMAHKTPDNDRCQNFDRQRTEIKTYGNSPDELLAVEGELVQYKWKFKIPIDFQVSPNFTHLHQIKSVGGPYESIPMITLTARKGSPDRLELRYTPTNNQNTIQTVNLDLLRGEWLNITETIRFSDMGTYSITIKKISDNTSLLDYSSDNIDMWQDGASFARPKWGIYRSLINIADLQDEEVLFNNFSIEENPSLSLTEFDNKYKMISLVPNPGKEKVVFKNVDFEDYDNIHVLDRMGRKVLVQEKEGNHQLDISSLSSGIYFVALLKSNITISVSKLIKE